MKLLFLQSVNQRRIYCDKNHPNVSKTRGYLDYLHEENKYFFVFSANEGKKCVYKKLNETSNKRGNLFMNL